MPGVHPFLVQEELNLVVEAGLVRGGQGEQDHAHVDLGRKLLSFRVKVKSCVKELNRLLIGWNRVINQSGGRAAH